MMSRASASTGKSRFSVDCEVDLPHGSPDPDASIPVRLLIVDDDPIALMAMQTLLDGPNRIIVKAETGQDALRHLLRQDFAVILLDVRMPRLDGYETAALVRQRERSRYTPIIFLSGVDTLDADVVRGLMSGAVDYLVKPVVPEILRNKVSVFVDLYRLRERVKQKAVQQSEERFRLLVEGVQDYAIFMLDGQGLVTTWNSGAEHLTGYRGTEILGRHYECFYPYQELASGQPARDLQMAAASEKEARSEQDRWMVRKDSSRFIANVAVTGLKDERGILQGYAVVIRDVTERKSAEDALHRLTSELERRVAARTSELVRMRDRLRAFAMQLNLTEQRERRRLASDLHDYLAQLLVVARLKVKQTTPLISHSKAVALLKEADQAVTQSLEYTRSLVTELAPPSLHDFGLLEALEWLASRLQRHGLSIAVKPQVETLVLPEDQAVLMYQSVRELLFNVLKHAAANQATISVTMTPEETLEVTVADDGHGFDMAAITTPVAGPAGFGLFSTRERMETMGGRLELHSAVGEGTRATLIIPYNTPVNAAAEPLGTQHPANSTKRSAPLSALAPLRVLLIDDHAMVRQGLRSLLNGHDDVQVVGEAGDGLVGIDMAGSLSPDVVVMDVTMPRIDGVEATRRILQDHPAIAVVGLSVHGTSQVEAAMKAAGAASFVSKDSAGDELYQAIMAAGELRSRNAGRETMKMDGYSRNQ